MTESGVLHKPIALVTAPRLVGNAERRLRVGGLDLTYMQKLIGENALVAEF